MRFAIRLSIAAALGLTTPVFAAAPATDLPQQLDVGRVYPLTLGAENRGVRLTVQNVSLADRYGAATAPAGKQFLILATQWENVIPWTVVREQQVPTEYQVNTVPNHLYVVVDGTRVGRLPIEHDALPGHVPLKQLKLSKIGDRITGNVVFVVPARSPQSLEVRFYDFAHGHMALPLIAPPEAMPAQKPSTPWLKNEILEAAVFDVRQAKDLDGQPAPTGMQYVVGELRARSQFTFEADAPAFDPKAAKGSKMQVGTVSDWTERDRYLTLVADGERGYTPIETQTELDTAPRFLPDVSTGGRFVFLAPANAKSLQLRCDFPNAKLPSGTIVHPKPVVFDLVGSAPNELPARKGLASIYDDVFLVAIDGRSAADSFAGTTAEAGKKFVVVDVTVTNRNKDAGEFFQTPEQLKYAAADGSTIEQAKATYAGVHRPAELHWIPSGQRRTFQLAFEVPASETTPRISYTGVTKAEVVALPAWGETVQAVAPNTATEVAAPPTKALPPEQEPTKVATASVPENAPATPAKAGKPKTFKAKIDMQDVEFPAYVTAKQPHQPKGLAGVGLTAELVNSAIDRGADALWFHILKNDIGERRQVFGSEEAHVLSMLALVHAGAHHRHPDLDAGIRSFLGRYNPEYEGDTYEAGVVCMLLEAYGDRTFRPLMQRTAQWLVETQGPQGTWGYGQSLGKQNADDAKPLRRPLVVAGSVDPKAIKDPVALKRVRPGDKGADGDNSSTQYAMLGLHAASRWGISVPPEVWAKPLDAYRKRQHEGNGGWAYQYASTPYGSMTCAGIASVALSRYHLREPDPFVDESIERGLAWMSAYFSVAENPNHEQEWVYYYLYGLERAGRILDTEFVGRHEWYPLGAKALLDRQTADGTWVGETHEKDTRLASSFALLFLTRATATLDAEPPTGPATLRTAMILPPADRVYFILDCSGSMLEEMGGRTKFDIAKDAMKALVAKLPDGTHVGLRVYGHSKRAIEPGAMEDTKLLLPVGPLDRAKFNAGIDALRAKGKTPLAYTVEQSLGDLGGGSAEKPTIVVLLTDGGEDTQPRKDPIAAAAKLAGRTGVQLKIVGFDINRDDWTEQLKGMAAAAGGAYITADQADALITGLTDAVIPPPTTFEVVDAGGKVVVAGEKFGASLKLPEGQYKLRTSFGGRTLEEPFYLLAASTASVTFDVDALGKGD